MLQLQGARPLTPFAIIYFQISVEDPPFNVKWVYTNASASWNKPPDPLCNNIFPSISWRPSFRVKATNVLFLTFEFKKMFKLQGACNSRSLLEIPFQGKRLQMSSFEHPNLQEMLQLQGKRLHIYIYKTYMGLHTCFSFRGQAP